MVFISVGSLNYPFPRLFEYIDMLIEEHLLEGNDVFAQTGHLNKYTIKNFKHVAFMERNELLDNIKKCDLFICHCGSGSLISALENNKKIITVPRRFENGEHQDDHQLELAEIFGEQKYVLVANTYDQLKKCIKTIQDFKPKQFRSNSLVFKEKLIEIILHMFERN